jgi:hypothetical protein
MISFGLALLQATLAPRPVLVQVSLKTNLYPSWKMRTKRFFSKQYRPRVLLLHPLQTDLNYPLMNRW